MAWRWYDPKILQSQKIGATSAQGESRRIKQVADMPQDPDGVDPAGRAGSTRRANSGLARVFRTDLVARPSR